MNDTAHWLKGYVAGYWEGFNFAKNPVGDEDLGGCAGGEACAAAESPAPDPGPLPLRGSLPGSRASDSLPLPAIRQPALPPEVKIAGEMELIFVHRGMTTALSMMVEVFREKDMFISASICERAARGVQSEDERR